ncbi:MAG: acetyl-CoA carboxylase biotin carboxyl carrier protein [Planctomycetota bacterium]
MEIRELKELVTMMKESGLTEILIVEDGRKVRLRKEAPPAPSVFPMAMAGGGTSASSSSIGGGDEAGGSALPPGVVEFKAPMVGTFYRAPSPEAESYCNVGDKVNQNSVVCIIEAMKVMNEIKSDVEGEIVEILAENGEAVEYGQTLLLIRRLG